MGSTPFDSRQHSYRVTATGAATTLATLPEVEAPGGQDGLLGLALDMQGQLDEAIADLRQRQFSQELQAVGTIGAVDYVAGLYYFNEHVSDDAATPNSMGVVYNTATSANFVTIPFCTGAANASLGAAVQGCSIDRASEVWSKSYAAYGQLTWNATDALHITVGGRYTEDKKKGVLHWSRNINYDTNTAAAALNGYVPLDKKWSREKWRKCPLGRTDSPAAPCLAEKCCGRKACSVSNPRAKVAMSSPGKPAIRSTCKCACEWSCNNLALVLVITKQAPESLNPIDWGGSLPVWSENP